MVNAIRRRFGGREAAPTNPPSGPGMDLSHVTSRNNAASSTVRVSGPLLTIPHQASSCGVNGTRSR